jgi:hypothetical protein
MYLLTLVSCLQPADRLLVEVPNFLDNLWGAVIDIVRRFTQFFVLLCPPLHMFTEQIPSVFSFSQSLLQGQIDAVSSTTAIAS